jgi:CRP-like cAMP-binding protein
MQTHGLGHIVRAHPFLAGLDERFLALVGGCARNVRFEDGQILFEEGQPADTLYLLRFGRVALQVAAPGRRPFTFQTAGEGEIVGISALIPPYRAPYDARAQTLVRAIAMDGTCLRDKCEADPRLGYDVLKRLVPVLAARLHATRQQALDVYGDPS